MAHHAEPHLKEDDTRRLGAGARSFGLTVIVVGVVALVASLGLAMVQGGWERFGFAYVTNYAFVLSLALGGLCFVQLTHLFRAGWVVAVRRIAEVMAGSMPVMAVLFVPILLYVLVGNGMVFPWAATRFNQPEAEAHHEATQAPGVSIITVSDESAADHDEVKGDAAETAGETSGGGGGIVAEHDDYAQAMDNALTPGKRPYLTRSFFTIRWIIYLTIWSLLGVWYLRTSSKQDDVASAEERAKMTRKMEIFSAPGTVLFAFTLTFAAVDLLMSLSPGWFSTMWGVYYFGGSFLGGVATVILALMALQKYGYLPSVNKEHYHDLGKLLFAFVFFWGYIAFSQFMLIWYGALPEESYWFELRGTTTQAHNPFVSGWTWVALVLLFGHLLIPFAGLLSRWIKRDKKLLGFWAAWLLVMHWIDLWWVVMPNYSTPKVPVPTVELLCLLGLGGIALGVAVLRATGQGLISAGDPRLGDSLGHVNPY